MAQTTPTETGITVPFVCLNCHEVVARAPTYRDPSDETRLTTGVPVLNETGLATCPKARGGKHQIMAQL